MTVRKDSQNTLAEVHTYLFSESGSYPGKTQTTDSAGVAVFNVSQGNYKIRADYQGSQYWTTAAIAADIVNTVGLSTGGGAFTLTIDKGSGPLTGVRAYVFTSGGSYLGLYGDSNTAGQVSFKLSDGSYKFRVDYLGYQFWSDVYTVPGTLAGALSIPHQNVTISVEGVYQGSQPITGVNVYLFTPTGSYLGQTGVMDGSGHVIFSLPNKAYKVRADYLGYSFWSGDLQFQDASVSILHGMAQITARKEGNPVSNAPVYLFSGSGSYLGLNAATNAEGQAGFLIPNRAYQFRVDEGGSQHWSAVTTITEGQINPIEVNWD